MPSDPGKPLPEDVMKLFSGSLDFEKKFIELCSEVGTLFCTPSGKELRFVLCDLLLHDGNFISCCEALKPLNCFSETDIIGSASPPATLCKNAKFQTEGTDANLEMLTMDEIQSTEIIGSVDIKAIPFSMTFKFICCFS